jgi:hypothetical protein
LPPANEKIVFSNPKAETFHYSAGSIGISPKRAATGASGDGLEREGNVQLSGTFRVKPYGGYAMKKIFLASAVAAFVISSAVAQTAVPTNFYVVRDSATKKCTVVDTKPTSTTVTVVENGQFPTKEQAETAMKTIKVCE